MNLRHGMIILRQFLTIRDYVKPYSTPIAFECLLLVKIFLLDDHRVAVHSHPLNQTKCSRLNAVHQYTLVPIQIFIRHGYKFIIIAPTPINGLVTPKLKLLMPLQLFLLLLVTLVQCLQCTMRHLFEIYAIPYAPLPVSFIALILLQPINVLQKACHRMNYNKSSNFSLNSSPVCNDKKTVVNNDPDSKTLVVTVVLLLPINTTSQEVCLQIVYVLLVRPLGMS